MNEISLYVGKTFIEAIKLCGFFALVGTVVFWFIRTAFFPCFPDSELVEE